MRTRVLLFVLAALGASLPAAAQPVQYYGQDSRFSTDTSTPTVYADGAPLAARQRFLANLDPATIQNESFETFTATTTRPGTSTAFSQALSFRGATAGTPVTATATALGAAIYQQTPARKDGVFATDGTNFIFGRRNVTFDFGTTPVNAFGFYLNDVETVPGVEVTLTPVSDDPDAVLPDVVLFYGPIPNSGTTGTGTGNGQLNFVGFIDKNTNYSRVVVGFPGVGNEGFGFDELVVGELPQVIASQVTVDQADIADQPGWRLLSAPVRGVTPNRLALQNLVQGVPGTQSTQAQYPEAGANLYKGYNGGGRYDYVLPVNTEDELTPGRGVWWYWYDRDITPDPTSAGGGTSVSVALDDFSLSAVGFPVGFVRGGTATGDTTLVFVDNFNSASDATDGNANPDPTLSGAPAGTVSPADDDFYLIGNPFPAPFRVSFVTAAGGTLQDAMYIWNPANDAGQAPGDGDPDLDGPGSYEIVYQTPVGAQQADVAVWQGMMAEVTSPSAPGANIAFTFDDAGIAAAGTPPFFGRTAAEAHLAFELVGETASGVAVRDAAATVRFRDDASAGWDRFDGSKPLPPTASYALVAPVGSEAKRQAVLSLPTGGASAVALAFTSNEAGRHTLTWSGTARDAVLTDHATGATVDLASAESYTFETTATDWTERFTLAFASTVAAGGAPESGTFVGLPMPNPSAGAVRLDVRVAAASEVALSVYDVLGRRVSGATAGLAAGAAASLDVPTAGLAPGAYVVVVEAEGVRETRRLTVVR